MTLRSRFYNEDPPPVFAYLDEIVSILGATKMSFWPIFAGSGDANTNPNIRPYGAGVTVQDAAFADTAGVRAFNASTPQLHSSGLSSPDTTSVTGGHIKAAADNAAHSHGNGTVDTAFSLGGWFMPVVALGSATSLVAKYNAAGAAEEYDFRYDASGNLALELHDASASTSEIGTGASDVIVPHTWQFCVATYDGGETAPVVHLYRNGVDQLASGATTESGAYVAMEDTATPLLIGGREVSGGPLQQFDGRINLPFITGKALTAAEVGQLYRLGKVLLGV